MTEFGIPLIETVGLTKKFGELEVLKGISERIYKGEVVSVIGPSGGGKSTFLRCLNLLETPTSGKVLFEGAELSEKSTDLDAYRRKIGMVFQQFNVFPHLKVIDNITLAPVLTGKMSREEANAQALELLEKVGLGDKAEEYPRKLSGGQKQRLAIVRALAMQPDVMLFDEPTSALDPQGNSRSRASTVYGLLRYMRLCRNHQHSVVRGSFHQAQPYQRTCRLPCKLFPSQSFQNQQYSRHPEQRDHPYILLLNELRYLHPTQKDDTNKELQKCYLR